MQTEYLSILFNYGKGRIFSLWLFSVLVILSGCKKESYNGNIQYNAEINPVLVTAHPSPQAVKVYDFLRSNFGLRILSGSMACVDWNTNEAEWVHSKTGKYPVLNCFDLMNIGTSTKYDDVSVVEEWWKSNGLVGLMWHWSVPVSATNASLQFYTDKTSFDISRAVQQGTWENGIIMADLAKAAAVLKELQQKNIPVIWRPFHEAAGGWFWWGAKGPQPLKQLWIIMFDYFRQQGINNLIWVWTEQPFNSSWYPGNEYVDIIGADVYNPPASLTFNLQYMGLRTDYKNKILALSECGGVDNINYQWESGMRWSFFMPWYDYNRTKDLNSIDFTSDNHLYANAEWWRKTFSNPHVIDRSQMPDLK